MRSGGYWRQTSSRSVASRNAPSGLCPPHRSLTPPGTDHEGVAQEVFLAVFRSSASFDPKRSAFSTWLFCSSTGNSCRASRRRGRAAAQVVREHFEGTNTDRRDRVFFATDTKPLPDLAVLFRK